MLFSRTALLATAAFVGFAAAQTETSTAATPTGSTLVHVVKVGGTNGELTFEPADLKAAVGEMVQFQFYPKNHSVVQAAFADPCVPISESAAGNGTQGFYSGFMAVATTDTTMPTFTVMINSTAPIWYYCSQGKHCQSGMVGVINAPATNPNRTLETFKSGAAAAPANLSPGQTGSGGSTGTGTVNPTSSATGSGSATTNTGAAAALSVPGSAMGFMGLVAALLML